MRALPTTRTTQQALSCLPNRPLGAEPVLASPGIIYGLADGVRVEFSVTAHSAEGAGVASEVQVASPVAVPQPPGIPRAIQATPADTTAFLQWAAPLIDGGAPITAYNVDCGASLTGEANCDAVGGGPAQRAQRTGRADAAAPAPPLCPAAAATVPITRVRLAGLVSGATYNCKVSAVNSAGTGLPATVAKFTTVRVVARR